MVKQTGHPYESIFAIPNGTMCKISHCEFLCNMCGTSVRDLSFNAIARGKYWEIGGIVHRQFDYTEQPAEICECVNQSHIWLTGGNEPFAITFGSASERVTVPIERGEEEAW